MARSHGLGASNRCVHLSHPRDMGVVVESIAWGREVRLVHGDSVLFLAWACCISYRYAGPAEPVERLLNGRCLRAASNFCASAAYRVAAFSIGPLVVGFSIFFARSPSRPPDRRARGTPSRRTTVQVMLLLHRRAGWEVTMRRNSYRRVGGSVSARPARSDPYIRT